jgi:hypothetical protein
MKAKGHDAGSAARRPVIYRTLARFAFADLLISRGFDSGLEGAAIG